MLELPDPDRLPDAPHPRDAMQVFGHTAAVEDVLQSLNSGKFHHAWMVTGPEGIGKATLAYKAAAAILAKPADEGGGFFGDAPAALEQLDLPYDHPINQRIRAGSEPGLFVLRRGPNKDGNKLSQVITVDEVRKLRNFFSMSAGGNGKRVVIVDSVDELNTQAANALLKMLEEPPAGAIMFLITHRPGAVLPTIRSRCRVLPLSPLPTEDMQAAYAQAMQGQAFEAGLQVLAQGSVGTAINLSAQGGLDVYTALIDVFSKAPSLDRGAVMRLAEQSSARGNEGGMDRFAAMLDMFLSRLARSSVLADDIQVCSGERELFARLNPALQTARIWANLQQQAGAALREGIAVNLDPVAMILDTAFKFEDTASRTLR
ncbi:MAG: DNA polymerase III subunit delta' [Planktomarina sp.]